MKRFLALLVIGAALCTSTAALAQAVKVTDRVNWRTQAANLVGGYIDSVSVRHATVAADTTVPIPMDGWVTMPDAHRSDVAAIDTTHFAIFYMVPVNRNLVTTADSVYIGAQVSMDGATWVATTPTQTFIAATLGGDTHNGAALLEGGASNSFAVVLKQHVAATGYSLGFSSATVPTWLQLYGWRYIRFIVHSDFNGEYEAFVTRFEYR